MNILATVSHMFNVNNILNIFIILALIIIIFLIFYALSINEKWKRCLDGIIPIMS
jgi:hypothetical protein